MQGRAAKAPKDESGSTKASKPKASKAVANAKSKALTYTDAKYIYDKLLEKFEPEWAEATKYINQIAPPTAPKKTTFNLKRHWTGWVRDRVLEAYEDTSTGEDAVAE